MMWPSHLYLTRLPEHTDPFVSLLLDPEDLMKLYHLLIHLITETNLKRYAFDFTKKICPTSKGAVNTVATLWNGLFRYLCSMLAVLRVTGH